MTNIPDEISRNIYKCKSCDQYPDLLISKTWRFNYNTMSLGQSSSSRYRFECSSCSRGSEDDEDLHDSLSDWNEFYGIEPKGGAYGIAN